MSRLKKDIETIVSNRKKTKDYDPEDENIASDDDSANNSQGESSTFGGREHYQAVGKSQLRNPESAPIDAKYAAVAVSRNDLASDDDDDDDDPFAFDDDDEDEDQDPFASTGSNTVARKATKLAKQEDESMSEEASDEFDHDEGETEPMDEEMESLEDSNSGQGDMTDVESGQSDSDAEPTSSARGDLRAFLSNDTKELAQGLSKAAVADAAKGRAVKRQYQTFDRVLDARMKLQKGLIASDELKPLDTSMEFASDAETALQAAEHSARALFDTITSFRESMLSVSSAESAPRKRKRTEPLHNPVVVGKIWEELNELEAHAVASRRATIDKWSSREKSFESALANAKSKDRFKNTMNQQDHLTAVLDNYVAHELEKHFRDQEDDDKDVENTLEADWRAYDDSAFYQSLLRELITSRSATFSVGNDIAGGLLPHKLHPSGNQQNKKHVDTKASKGRKVRYTVHEKLQNFMAAEGDTGRDTAMWTERGKNEFFGSLFGQDRVLAEDHEDGDAANNDGIEAEVEALRLFRT